jgi:hypothetical protein
MLFVARCLLWPGSKRQALTSVGRPSSVTLKCKLINSSLLKMEINLNYT